MALELRKPVENGYSYTATQLFTAAMFMGAALCLLAARTWKLAAIEKQDPELSDTRGRSGMDGQEKSTIAHKIMSPLFVQAAFKWEKV